MDYAPIILLLAGGTLAWLSTRTASAASLAGEGPVNIEKLGGDVKFPQESDTIAELRKLMTDTLMRGGEIQFNSPEFQLALTTPIRGTSVSTGESVSLPPTIKETVTIDLLPEGRYMLMTDMGNVFGHPGEYSYWYDGDTTPIWSLPGYGMIWENYTVAPYTQTDYTHVFTTNFKLANVLPGEYFYIRRT